MGTKKYQMKRRYNTFKSLGRFKSKDLKDGDFTKILYCKCPLCSKLRVEPTFAERHGHLVYEYCPAKDRGCLSYINERESSPHFLRS